MTLSKRLRYIAIEFDDENSKDSSLALQNVEWSIALAGLVASFAFLLPKGESLPLPQVL